MAVSRIKVKSIRNVFEIAEWKILKAASVSWLVAVGTRFLGAIGELGAQNHDLIWRTHLHDGLWKETS